MTKISERNTESIKICLLGASFNTTNMGVNALTMGVMKTIVSCFENVEIYLLDYGSGESQYSINLFNKVIIVKVINIRFSKKILRNNIAYLIVLSLLIKLIPFKKLQKIIKTKNYFLEKIQRINVFGSIAGGDSFSDIYGLKRFLYVSLPQLLVFILGKRLVLLPQTYGPYKRKIVIAIARYIFKHSYIIFARDYAGIKEVKKIMRAKNNAEKLRFCYDVGFIIDPIKPKSIDLNGLNSNININEKTLVGLNVSGLLYMGGYTRDNMFGLKIDYKDLMYSVIDYMIINKDAVILLIPHVFGDFNIPESDVLVCDELFRALQEKYPGNLLLVRGLYNQNEIKYIIGMCHFFIGSRMHACIAALSQDIPTVAIAYSKKFLGVMETLEIPDIVADVRKLQKDEVISIIDDIYNKQAIVKQKLHIKMIEVKNVVYELFNISVSKY